MRQYIKDKPCKFGFKLWVLAESGTGYTLDMNVYTGRRDGASEHGLSYDVVMKLIRDLKNQGYILYTDSFYTSPELARDLVAIGILTCGTVRENRRGFSDILKDKTWSKTARRGDMRWVREGQLLFMQWKDNKVVTVLSTAHGATGQEQQARRRVKEQGEWRQVEVRKPGVIHEYNTYMSGVDKSDQLLAHYNVLLKCVRWWKTLFFHCIDIAVVNSFILFQQWRELHPQVPELQRPAVYGQLEFREELIRQLGDIDENTTVPLYTKPTGLRPHKDYYSEHLPVWTEKRLNCKVCYKTQHKEVKSSATCTAVACKGVHLCLNKGRNCFRVWHSQEFDKHR